MIINRTSQLGNKEIVKQKCNKATGLATSELICVQFYRPKKVSFVNKEHIHTRYLWRGSISIYTKQNNINIYEAILRRSKRKRTYNRRYCKLSSSHWQSQLSDTKHKKTTNVSMQLCIFWNDHDMKPTSFQQCRRSERIEVVFTKENSICTPYMHTSCTP